jgi:hypothetical protein
MNAENSIKRNENPYRPPIFILLRKVVTAPTLAPAIKLGNPSGKYFPFGTQWGNDLLLPFEPCKKWEVCQVRIDEIEEMIADFMILGTEVVSS